MAGVQGLFDKVSSKDPLHLCFLSLTAEAFSEGGASLREISLTLTNMQFTNDISFAHELDIADPLKHFRDQFLFPGEIKKKQIYFLGNSLGLQPVTAKDRIEEILKQWADHGVEGFFHGTNYWYDYHDRLTKPLSNIVGALTEEVVVMNQLTINCHLMLASFYQPSQKRNKIICEYKAFPSDQYMLETHVRFMGFDPAEAIIEVKPREGETIIRTEDILSAIEKHKDGLALVFWGGVNYYSGQLFDMKTITAAAHKAGAKAGYDLAHAAGNVHLALHDWNVDFACWCSYKYLNSGPGAVGGVYVHERYHTDDKLPRLAGWWGYEKKTRFEMKKGFVPVPSAEGWQLSTPPFLQMACHKAALDIFEEATMERLLAKTALMNNYLRFILKEINSRSKPVIQIITPEEDAGKNCQVSMLLLQKGKELFDLVRAEGIMADWRDPDVIRIAPVPLYNTFTEIHTFSEVLKRNMHKLYNN